MGFSDKASDNDAASLPTSPCPLPRKRLPDSHIISFGISKNYRHPREGGSIVRARSNRAGSPSAWIPAFALGDVQIPDSLNKSADRPLSRTAGEGLTPRPEISTLPSAFAGMTMLETMCECHNRKRGERGPGWVFQVKSQAALVRTGREVTSRTGHVSDTVLIAVRFAAPRPVSCRFRASWLPAGPSSRLALQGAPERDPTCR